MTGKILALSCLLLLGSQLLACTTASCTRPAGPGTAVAFSQLEAQSSAFQPEATATAKQSLVGEAATAGAVLLGLEQLLAGVESLITTTSGEAQAALGALRASVANTIVDFKSLMGGDLNTTIDKLNDIQKGFIHDVEHLIRLGTSATQEITSGATEAAIMAVREADIAAYDAVYALPGRPQTPRLVYWTPKAVSDDGKGHLVELHGNFLNVRPPQITVDGAPATPAGASNNATQVLLDALPAGGSPVAFRKVEAKYASCEAKSCLPFAACEPKLGVVQTSAGITVTPKSLFTVTATITPKGKQVQHSSFDFAFEKIETRCAFHYPVEADHCLSGGWELAPPVPTSPNVYEQQCPSAVIGMDVVGDRCVKVKMNIQGCGCNFLVPQCNHGDPVCRGRGILKYTLTLPAKRNAETVFPTQSFQESNTATRTFAFHYDRLPPESTVTAWQFAVTITTPQGLAIHLSDAIPEVDKVRAKMDSQTGTLAVEFEKLNVALLREAGGKDNLASVPAGQ